MREPGVIVFGVVAAAFHQCDLIFLPEIVQAT